MTINCSGITAHPDHTLVAALVEGRAEETDPLYRPLRGVTTLLANVCEEAANKKTRRRRNKRGHGCLLHCLKELPCFVN